MKSVKFGLGGTVRTDIDLLGCELSLVTCQCEAKDEHKTSSAPVGGTYSHPRM